MVQFRQGTLEIYTGLLLLLPFQLCYYQFLALVDTATQLPKSLVFFKKVFLFLQGEPQELPGEGEATPSRQ